MPSSRVGLLSVLSSRLPRASRGAKRGICFFTALIFPFLATSISAQTPPKRPVITGIDHVRLYVTDIDKGRAFYSKLFGVRLDYNNCYGQLHPCFTIGWKRGQKIALEQAPPGETNFVDEIAFATHDINVTRAYLVGKGLTATRITKDKYEKSVLDAHFEVRDPEGHSISFIQVFGVAIDDPLGAPWYVQIIHTGTIVHDRPAMEHFYKDILGFRPYWHGGRTDERDDWVSLQVPDGSDWVEFMLNVPDNADKRTLGVANHIALGVTDIQAAKAQLIKNGLTLNEEPKIGRGGKWQLNVYDPDGTRIEFMEFTPVQKPCCSEYTSPHPKP